jgi:hypothetical protein
MRRIRKNNKLRKTYWLNYFEDGNVTATVDECEFNCKRNVKVSKECYELWMYWIGESLF